MKSLLRLAAILPFALATQSHAADTWVEVRSPHFTVVSDGGKGTARRVATQLEQIRAGFQVLMPNARLDPGKPIIALAARNRESMKALLPEYWADEKRGRPAGLFVSGPGKHYIALRVDGRAVRPYGIINHEYTHLLVNLNFPWLPVWINEGLAEFYAASKVEEKRITIGSRHEGHLRFLQLNTPIPLEQFLVIDHSSPWYTERNRKNLFYAQSWAMVHYFMMADKGIHRDKLGNYVALLSQGRDLSEVARLTFGDPDQFEDALVGYAHRERFYYQTVSAQLELPPSGNVE